MKINVLHKFRLSELHTTTLMRKPPPVRPMHGYVTDISLREMLIDNSKGDKNIDRQDTQCCSTGLSTKQHDLLINVKWARTSEYGHLPTTSHWSTAKMNRNLWPQNGLLDEAGNHKAFCVNCLPVHRFSFLLFLVGTANVSVKARRQCDLWTPKNLS